MTDVRAFLDTNILIYLYSDFEPDKKKISLNEFNKYDRFVNTQVLTEFCNICLKKLSLSTSEINSALSTIISKCNLLTVTDSDLRMAVVIIF